MKEQRSRDTTTTVVLSLILGICSGLLIMTNMEFKWMFAIVASITGGFFCAVFMATFFVQEAQEGTSASLKNNWSPIFKSWCFYLCPAAAIVTGLIFEWIK